MIYLLVALAIAVWLLWRWSSLQARRQEFGALAGSMTRDEAAAELARCRAALLAGQGTLGAAEADRLAERGAWMMDRIRGLDGAQTGPAPRIRAKMELIDAVAQDAGRTRPKG